MSFCASNPRSSLSATLDFSPYESSRGSAEPDYSAIASVLPSVFDSAAISDALIEDKEFEKICETYSLPRVDIYNDEESLFRPRFLGAGASYRVFVHKFHQWDNLVAVKHIKSSMLHGNVGDVSALGQRKLTLLREIQSSCLFSGHPNIINLLGWGVYPTQTEWSAFLITEYTPLGSLDSYLQENGDGLEASHFFKICTNVAQGIHAMHSQNMVHGDVKAANVLIFEEPSGNFTAKLSDMGFSTCLVFSDGCNNKDACYKGTSLYNAPEIKSQGSNRFQDLHPLACDVYSFGLLVWTVFKRGTFFLDGLSTSAVGLSQDEIVDSMSAFQLLEHALEFARARESHGEAGMLSQILSGCLQVEAIDRSPIERICKVLDPDPPGL